MRGGIGFGGFLNGVVRNLSTITHSAKQSKAKEGYNEVKNYDFLMSRSFPFGLIPLRQITHKHTHTLLTFSQKLPSQGRHILYHLRSLECKTIRNGWYSKGKFMYAKGEL